jgi:hypothetical protein
MAQERVQRQTFINRVVNFLDHYGKEFPGQLSNSKLFRKAYHKLRINRPVLHREPPGHIQR